jgi:hypothetical protein
MLVRIASRHAVNRIGAALQKKRAAQACSLACDELIDKGAIITGE